MTIVHSLPGHYLPIDRDNMDPSLKRSPQRLEQLYAVLRGNLLDYRRHSERHAADIVAIISDMSFIKELSDTETRKQEARNAIV
jgi:hypothetical protein